jgi:hypothetical protein
VPAAPGSEFHGPFSPGFCRFFLEDVDPILHRQKVMLLLAGDFTGKAAQAFVRIEEERLLSHFQPPP